MRRRRRGAGGVDAHGRRFRPVAWALGFPFGQPAAALGKDLSWSGQLARLRAFGDDAYGFGLECVRLAAAETGRTHVRWLADVEAKTPFDPYHFRIIYQTFYGMRDVLGPLRRQPDTAVLPFQCRKLENADRAVVENCQASTLKRLGLPHQRYKQPPGGPLTSERLRARPRPGKRRTTTLSGATRFTGAKAGTFLDDTVAPYEIRR